MDHNDICYAHVMQVVVWAVEQEKKEELVAEMGRLKVPFKYVHL